jgi:hypothetical protein
MLSELLVCTICGAMSDSEAQAEAHFNEAHAGTDWKEDAFWVEFAEAFSMVEA